MKRLRSRRWGPFRQEWYSICSGHFYFNPDCPRCQAGEWRNVWRHEIGHFVYTSSPDLWRWWANLSWNRDRTMNFLKKHFPNIR